MEEVIVTAQKREENLQRAALSVAALNGDELRNAGKTNLVQMLRGVAGVETGNGGYFFIRGVGNGPQFGQDASVTLTTNGVFMQRGQTPRDTFYDVARVEVARGPQTTLTGRTSEGGAVSVITNEPGLDKLELKGTVEGGNYNLFATQGVINVPLNEMFALRIATTTVRRDGYFTADGGDVDSESGRVRLLFKPNEDFKVVLSGDYSTSSTTGTGTGNSGIISFTAPFTTANGYYWNPTPPLTYNTFKIANVYADVSWNTQFANFYFQPTYQHADVLNNGFTTNYVTYTTQRNLGFSDMQALARATNNVRSSSPQRQRSYEFRVSNPDDADIKWLVGAYYYWQSQVLATQNANGSLTTTSPATAVAVWPAAPYPQIYPQSTRRISEDKDVYAQATLPLTATWRVTGGVRYSQDSKQRAFSPGNYLLPDGTTINSNYRFPINDNLSGQASSSSFVYYNIEALNAEYKRTNWLAKLEHDLTDSSLLYAMVSTGWKTGSFLNVPSPDAICGTTPTIGGAGSVGCAGASPYLTPGFKAAYDPEFLTSYEVGSKNTLLDDHLRLNASLYYYNYRNYQFNYSVNFFNPATGVDPDFLPVASYTGNAGTVRNYGGELESSYLLSDNDKLDLNISYMHARFGAVPVSEQAAPGVKTWAASLRGLSLPHSPTWQIMPKYAHSFIFGSGASLVASADAQFSTKQIINTPASCQQIPGFYPAGSCTAAALTVPDYARSYWEQKSFAKFNLSFAYNGASNNWTLTAYINNLTDKTTFTDLFAPNAFTGTGQTTFAPDEPRAYGVILSAKL
ncbi:MAG: TonB-dependent receptor [Steroidobacteraceae bacterium]